MTLTVDLFCTFRSPYCYLIMGRVLQMKKDYDIQVNARFMYPMAIIDPAFFERVDPRWMPYIERDVVRTAEFLGMPWTGWPNPDPVIQDMDTLAIPAEQPHISRLTRLGVEADQRGRGVEFIREVSRLLFGSGVRNWHEGDHLARAAQAAGLNLAEMDDAIAVKAEEYDAILHSNQLALRAAGHWGVPTLVFQNEPFFGQDRLNLLLWRLKQHGLQAR